jgi:ketosteroid isomerase-like protein
LPVTISMMRNAMACAALALALTSVGARGQSVPGPGSQGSAGQARYRAEAVRDAMVVLDEWQSAWTRDDVRALGRLYHKDAMLRLPGQPAGVQGRAAVAELLRSRLPEFGGMELEAVDVEAGDQLLYLFQRYTMASPDSSAGPSALAPLSGTCITVLERDAGSGWRIRSQIFEAPGAVPSAAVAQ